jgi:type VI secretion system secreted protein Hcp
MAHDFILKIKDIDGESAIEGHKNEIEIDSFSWGVGQHGSTHTGTGSGAGKSSLHDITFSKHTDKSSTLIAQACCVGQHIENAKLFIRKSGGKNAPIDYLTIELKDVFVSNFQVSGHNGSGLAAESFSLNFGEISMVYQTQDSKGKATKAGEMAYNVAKQKAT